MLAFGVKRRGLLFAFTVAGTLGCSMLGWVWVLPHYLAPVVPLFVLLTVQAIRQLRVVQGPYHVPVGRYLVWAGGCWYLLAITVQLTAYSRSNVDGWNVHRVHCSGSDHEGGRHLVFVRYADNHSPLNQEWVYNAGALMLCGCLGPNVELGPGFGACQVLRRPISVGCGMLTKSHRASNLIAPIHSEVPRRGVVNEQ